MGEGAPTGRPARYCRRSCRQRAYEARRDRRERDHLEELLRVANLEREQLLDDRSVLRETLADLDFDGVENPELVSLVGALHRLVGLPEGSERPPPGVPTNAGNPRSVK